MPIDLTDLTTHDSTDHCPVCHAEEIVGQILVPAVSAWEQSSGLPQFALALHGAVGLLGTLIAEGVSRDDLERTVSALLDEIERRIAEDKAMGGPPQGTA